MNKIKLPGLGVLSAMRILAAIGNISRFPSAKHLVGYAGLEASVPQLGETNRGGRITKEGRSDLRGVLVEAAWVYEKILVQDILDRAGIGRTTFYAHYFDKEDVLNSMVEQELAILTGHIAQAAQGQRIIPSLELFVHAYASANQQLRALICSSAGKPLLDALQAALCRLIEPTLSTLCAKRRSLPIPLPVVSEYLAGAFLTLFKWWVTADMPYPPEQMDSIFQQLALPGVWAMLKEK